VQRNVPGQRLYPFFGQIKKPCLSIFKFMAENHLFMPLCSSLRYQIEFENIKLMATDPKSLRGSIKLV